MVTMLCGMFGLYVLSGRSKPSKHVGLAKPIMSYRDVFRDADLLVSITNGALGESFSQSKIESMGGDNKLNRVLFSRNLI